MNAFAADIEQKSGTPISRCYQCGKCSAGCPVAQWFEWPNHGLIRKVQLGARDELFASRAIWLCVACETCGTRCPNGIYMSRLCDALRQGALAAGVRPAEPAVGAFHGSFVGSVRNHGRVHELMMLVSYKLKTKDFFTDVGAGIKLFLKGKIPFLPSKVKGKDQVDRLFAESRARKS